MKKIRNTKIVLMLSIFCLMCLCHVSYAQPPTDAAERFTRQVELAKIETAKQLDDSYEKMTPFLVRRPGGAQMMVSAYASAQVVDVFGDTKKKLLSELDDPTAAALREYIKAAFPTAKLEPVVSETKGGYFLVSERSAEYSKEAISKFLEKLAAVANQPTFDLAIVSAQSPAQFDMWPDVGNAYSTATDGTLKKIWLGNYKYKVAKNGYKTINGNLNSVDQKGTTLTCILYPNDSNDGPYPCTFQ